jgi:hypothetical protein
VHTGQTVSLEQARESLDACEGMIDHVQDVLTDSFFGE